MSSDTPRTDACIQQLKVEDFGWHRLVDLAEQLERELSAETKLKRDIANSRIIILKKIIHCENCGDSWYDSGISNASCPNCRIADLQRERDALREGAERRYRAGLERAREICLGKKETMSFRTNNVPVEVTGFNNGVHDCADAIQREVEK